MTVVLSFLKSLYFVKNTETHFIYSPPFERKKCSDIRFDDSQLYLGEDILPPGIPFPNTISLEKVTSHQFRQLRFLYFYKYLLEKDEFSPHKKKRLCVINFVKN